MMKLPANGDSLVFQTEPPIEGIVISTPPTVDGYALLFDNENIKKLSEAEIIECLELGYATHVEHLELPVDPCSPTVSR